MVRADAMFGKLGHGYMLRLGDFAWTNYGDGWLNLRVADGTLPNWRAKWLAL
jgi:hypothetical protein